jgi:hypothetical protein
MEVFINHAADRFGAAEFAVKAVVVNAVGDKTGCRGGAVAAADRLRHALDQGSEFAAWI